MLALSSAALGFSALGGLTTAPTRAAAPVMETRADLEKLATQLNPVVGFWDPLQLSEYNFWGEGEEATIGWLRESEIKHGRIAMAGFVGFIVHANGIRTQGDAIAQSVPTDLTAPAVWDALPEIAKWQIVLFVGVMEAWRENRVVLAAEGQTHYMKGGKPGYFPSFDMVPHPVPFNLYDPWGVMAEKSEEQKAKGRLVEINNGRLAMIGIMGFMAASKGLIVPGMDSLGIAPYSGEIMAPFSASDASLPFVSDMLAKVGTLGY
jgi:hypothetical protein